MRTAKVVLRSVKSEDWAEMMTALGVPEKDWGEHLEYGEFADLEIEVGEDMKIVGGRLLRRP